jgi:hypothetical protein
MSCKVKDHASWSRACLVFAKRAAEFNIRNPDNSLQYFPTADVWTWYTVEKPPPTVLATPQHQSQPPLKHDQTGLNQATKTGTTKEDMTHTYQTTPISQPTLTSQQTSTFRTTIYDPSCWCPSSRFHGMNTIGLSTQTQGRPVRPTRPARGPRRLNHWARVQATTTVLPTHLF